MAELEFLDHTSTYEKHALGRGALKLRVIQVITKIFRNIYSNNYIKLIQ
jgi:hypothetical protein